MIISGLLVIFIGILDVILISYFIIDTILLFFGCVIRYHGE